MGKSYFFMKYWLLLSAFMVIAMIFVGGLTRLTDSGLSIVEWKPISGIIPPITQHAWEKEFADYKTSPEYQKLNQNFILEDFKSIFWLEFIHRILGRLTGLIIIIPVLILGLQNKLTSFLPYISMILLIIFQGFMGWYMVKSGLVDNPYVSHYRLAAHLITAVILYSVILWQIFVVMSLSCGILPSWAQDRVDTACGMTITLALITLLLIYIQIFLGALVAGLDAGLVYNEFPLMGHHFIPMEFEWNLKLFNDPVLVQFIHRCMAYVVVASSMCLAYKLFNYNKFLSYIIILSVLTQFLLGILTLLYIVPIKLALAHQLFAVLLLSIILYVIFTIKEQAND